MDGNSPRALIKALLRGEPPPRPLLMPIIVSVGSRLESLPMRDFQRNPTRISNALRQIRSVLKVDGLACYFDPLLEIEALGGKIEWLDGSATLAVSPCSDVHDLEKLPSPQEVAQYERVRVGADVLHRLRTILHDDPALMVGVTGPLKLAAQLLGPNNVSLDALQFASEVSAAVCKTFLESGADVVFLAETFLPQMSPELWLHWVSLLDPLINVVRFYESLPVLLLRASAVEGLGAFLSRQWDCVLCPASEDADAWQGHRASQRFLGIAWPTKFRWKAIDSSYNSTVTISQVLHSERPILLLSTGDLPSGCDLKQLSSMLATMRTGLLRAV